MRAGTHGASSNTDRSRRNVSVQLPKRQQFLPQFETASIIHPEKLYGRPSGGGQSFNAGALDGKMIGPTVATRMKQGSYRTRNRINPCEVRSFVKVAAMAGQGQIASVIETAMLFRNDMFDVVEQFTVRLVQVAVFARSPARARTSRRVPASIYY